MIKLQNKFRRKVILITILIFVISVNFFLFSPVLNQSNSSNKVQEKNFEIYNLKVNGLEINIITPENKTYTAPMSGYYPATYGFENDEDGSDPDDWVSYENGGTVNVISSLGTHNNVVELHDTGGGAFVYLRHNFTAGPQTDGAIEWWWRTTDATLISRFRVFAGNYTEGIVLQLADDKFQYYAGAVLTDIPGVTPLDNTWYHMRIIFDCVTDTFDLYIDETFELDDGAFKNPVYETTLMQFQTVNIDNNYYEFVDAVGFSWDPNYDIGDNINEGLLLSFENITILDWMGYSLDNQANTTILGNTTILFPSEGVHTIQVFGNDSVGSIYGSDIRYFTTLYYPVITIISPNPNEFFGSSAPNFDISINESNLQSRWYSLNSGVNITFSGFTGTVNQTEWEKLANGSVTIRFYANDSWGLEGYAAVSVQKDLFVPNSLLSFVPHSGIDVVNESTEFYLSADDGLGLGVSYIRYKINDSNWVTYAAPFTLTSYSYGDILVSYQAIDLVDNYEIIQTLLIRRTDTMAPTSLISFTPYSNTDVVIKSTTFSITSTDDQFGSGISMVKYKINNSIWFDYLGPFDLSNYEYGEYSIMYQAIDVVGNIEVEHGITVILVPEPSEPGIPGYHLFIMICIISIVSALITRIRLKSRI